MRNWQGAQSVLSPGCVLVFCLQIFPVSCARISGLGCEDEVIGERVNVGAGKRGEEEPGFRHK